MRYQSWIVAPSSHTANASPFVRSTNESSGPKSAPCHAVDAAAVVVVVVVVVGGGDVVGAGDVEDGAAVVVVSNGDTADGVDDVSVAVSHPDSKRAPSTLPAAPSRSVRREVMAPQSPPPR